MSSLSIFAYLDPGAGSLLLQALVGGFAGLFVVVRHFYRLIRFGQGPQASADRSQVCN
ncbi:MAG: hypothetical protein ACKO2P_19910 [Planctomycetota bacterium]